MIKLANIVKSFGDNKILDGFSFDFTRGAYCITGASGAGKTTLLNIIMGLASPDSGVVTKEPGQNVAAVFQDDRLIANLSAVKNIALVTDRPKAEICGHLVRVGLADIGDKPVSELSGGMKRRVAIVRALINGDPVIVLDEPFKGLDAVTKELTAAYVREMTDGSCVIMVTHDESDATLLGAELFAFSPSGLVIFRSF